jgi:hypothetical protein
MSLPPTDHSAHRSASYITTSAAFNSPFSTTYSLRHPLRSGCSGGRAPPTPTRIAWLCSMASRKPATPWTRQMSDQEAAEVADFIFSLFLRIAEKHHTSS